MLKGYEWRNEREWERLAWLASHIMNASGNLKKPVTMSKLLGKGPAAKEDHRTKEERESDLLNLEREIEAKRSTVNGNG